VSGTNNHDTSVNLTISAPDFSLAATPPAQSIARGSSTSYTVTLTAVNGFAGDTTLSVSGLPSGVTATFSPAIITGGSGSSTLTIDTLPSTAAGTSALSVSAVSGTLNHGTSVDLTITAPDFSLTATP